MGYIVIEDFRVGLDARRDAVVGLPGSLIEAENGHITSGGDFERAKKFVSKYSLPAGETFGMHASSGNLYVFGSVASPSVPAGVTYQRLQHPDGLAMTGVRFHESFDGKNYVIAEFTGGKLAHFYDGDLVTDWLSGVVRPLMLSNEGIASHLAGLIDGQEGVTASAAGNVITITGTAGVAFTISASTENGGSVDDQTATVATPTPAIAGVTGVAATALFTVSGGTASAGVNKVTSVKVDGVEILGSAVDWTISNSATATNIAAQIASYNSSPEYTATANDGVAGRVTVAAGSAGAAANGRAILITYAGDVVISNVLNMSGGVDAVAGQAQVSTVTIGGTFEVGDKFTVTINGRPFGYEFNPDPIGTALLTYDNKMYSVGGSLLNFSAVDEPTVWNRSDAISEGTDSRPGTPGAGFVNMANQDAGSEDLVGIGLYQSYLAAFSRNAVQIEFVDPDPSSNQLLQTLKNTGTVAPKSITSYGNSDTFYLDDNGIRSLRARDATDIAFASDVGSPIDPIVLAYMKTLTEDEIAEAVGIIAEEGRYWLALGERIFVFSYYPSAKISAWSYYDLGFQITDLQLLNKRVYARAGDTIYLYGGDDNATYPGAGEMVARVRLPYLSAGKPATKKTWQGLDAAIQGQWRVKFLLDPRDESLGSEEIIVSDITYPDGMITIGGESTHCAPLFVCSAAGYAKISSVVVHHDLEEAG